jgi:hypothetical protein
MKRFCLRTEVRGDFNIHGTKYFQDAVFQQESKKYDVVSLLYLWLAKKPVFGQPKVQEAYNIIIF